MTLGPALTTGGVVGVIMIVVCFYMWFFLCKSSSTNDSSNDTNNRISYCYFGLYGRHKCHVALPAIGVGRVIFQVCRVCGLAFCAFLVQHFVRRVGRAEGLLGLICLIWTGLFHHYSVDLAPLYYNTIHLRTGVKLLCDTSLLGFPPITKLSTSSDSTP